MIAISGGNIAILAGLMLVAFRVAGMLGRIAMLSAIVALLAYGRLVGGGASVDRASSWRSPTSQPGWSISEARRSTRSPSWPRVSSSLNPSPWSILRSF